MASRGIFSQLSELARAVADAARSTPDDEGTSSAPPHDAGPGDRRRDAGPSEPAAGQRAPRLRREPERTPRLRREPVDEAPRRRADDDVRPTYAPERDGEPDPGEVVWAWVPYEDDPSRGKDRPVLVLAVDTSSAGEEVVALMLTSKDHVGAGSRDAADELRHGRHWLDVGSGAWDAQGRPSEVRLDRVLHLPVASVRREGSALDERTFHRVVVEASRLHGWS